MHSRVKLAYVLKGMIVENRVNESVGAKERWKMKKEKKRADVVTVDLFLLYPEYS